MGYDPAKDHPSFEQDLIDSRDAVFAAARWLTGRGEEVTVPGFQMRDSVDERYEFQDNGDLLIKKPVEVKKRELQFESAEDYPYRSVFLNEQYKHDQRPPLFYLVFSNDLRCCITVESHTSDQWTTESKWDQKKSREATFYAAPLEVCTFKKVPERILQ